MCSCYNLKHKKNTEVVKMSIMGQKKKSLAAKSFWERCKKNKALIFMVIPGMVMIFIFNYIPIYGILIAFQDYNPMAGIFGGDWVGLKYFKQFLTNPYIGRLFKNTLQLGLYSLFWGFPGPIILALLLDQLPYQKYKRVVQSVSYLPHFISMVVVVGIIKNFCGMDGIFNMIRDFFGADKVAFLAEPKYFRTIYVTSGIWQGIGWGSIIYLAALSAVDPQLHEAGAIDGANRWQKIRYITWPSILPTTSIMLIFNISGILGSDFQKILLLYSEATYSTADVINTYVYREGILGGKFEYTTAIGLMMSIISFILLTLANHFSKKVTDTGLW